MATIKPRVLVDADVLFAGSASALEYGASLVVLHMAEITLIEAITSHQVITEVERNLKAKIPKALPAFQLLVSRCLQVAADPTPADMQTYTGLADEKDLPMLVTAVQQNCPWLVTFNIHHFQPDHPAVTVLQPGDFLQQVRYMLANL